MRSGPSALQGSIRLGRLRLPRLIPPTFLQGCKPTVCLYALQKRRKQPERYVPFILKSILNKGNMDLKKDIKTIINT
jgi:hypothetical protein